MKTLLLALIASVGLFAQATLTVAVPGETNTTMAFSAEMIGGVQVAIKALGGPASTTLTAPTLTSDTSFTVASATGVTVGMGVLIGGEVSLITAIASKTLTVVRARTGTSAVASLSGAQVDYLAAGSYGAFVKNVITHWAQQNLPTYSGTAVKAAQAAIVTQQAAIATALAAAVQ